LERLLPSMSENATCGAAFGKAVSIDPVQVYNETPMRGLKPRPRGCPWVESSRDPWLSPRRSRQTCPVLFPIHRGACANTVELTKEH